MLRNANWVPVGHLHANSIQFLVFFRYCKRTLDTLKSFCYFWALDMAPTYAVPGLFVSNSFFCDIAWFQKLSKVKKWIISKQKYRCNFQQISRNIVLTKIYTAFRSAACKKIPAVSIRILHSNHSEANHIHLFMKNIFFSRQEIIYKPGLEINRSPPVVTDVPPKPHRWTTAVASADFAVATGGSTHSPTGGPPEIPPVVTDCSTDGTRMMHVQ